MNLDQLLAKVKEDIKPYYIQADGQPFDDIHDWNHMRRVYGACLRMLEVDQAANRGEVLMAALLHDTGRSKADQSHAEFSYEISQELLKPYAAEFASNNLDLEKVLLMVRYHTVAHMCPDQKIASSVEFNIFTDADKMDMFGASGVLRVPIAVAYHGKPTVYWAADRIKLMSQPSEFQFQSEAGKIVGKKYKDFLATFSDALEAQRADFEIED